jgi:hypothetical protein
MTKTADAVVERARPLSLGASRNLQKLIENDFAALKERRLDKLTKGKAALELSALELEPQIVAMQKRLDYALSNPDLVRAAKAPEVPTETKTASAEEFHAQVTGQPWPENGPTTH